MEIQQSPLYAHYIESLKWAVEKVQGKYLFIKKIPFTGGILKIQRVKSLPPIPKLLPLFRQYNIRTLAVEPDGALQQQFFSRWLKKIPTRVKLNTDYFLPTKTIRVDLTPQPEKIFHAFSETKRRGVRRAQKNGVTVITSDDIKTFIRLKNKSAGFLGSITTFGIDKLWPFFHPDHASILLAHNQTGKPVGGILLLYWDHIAYYWIAGASREGKKLFAPTLLVWCALLAAKKHNCAALDFVGVWDERLPNKNKQWLGFTKFKEGFGGTPLYYPLTNPN